MRTLMSALARIGIRGRRRIAVFTVLLVASAGAASWAYWSPDGTSNGSGASSAAHVNKGGTPTGTLTGFQPTEGITYKLDDPSTGTTLSGTPTSADDSGNAENISITLPQPADGAHTIYAVGDATPTASQASAAITVDTTAPT